jgi:hypothetical protein
MVDSTSPHAWMTARIGARIAGVHLEHARGMPFGTRRRPDTARTAPTGTGFAESTI